jgi:pilus assembly protein CpaE
MSRARTPAAGLSPSNRQSAAAAHQSNPRVFVVGGTARFRQEVAAALAMPVDELGRITETAAGSDALSGRQEVPQVLVLSPDVGDKNAVSLAKKVTSESPATAIVLVRDGDLNGLLPAAVRAGIRDFVDLSKGPDDLREALERAVAWSASLQPLAAKGDAKLERGEIICVFSSKGGSGKTFIASNLAAALAINSGKDTALIDLDLGMGDVFSFYGSEPVRPIQDLLTLNLESDDDALFASATPLHDHLWGFGAPPDLTAQSMTGDEVSSLLRSLQKTFSYIVVDCPAEYTDPVLAAFDLSEELCLVAGLDVVGIKHLSKALETLIAIGVPEEKLRIVLNRADSKVGLDPGDVERIMKIKIDSMIPSSRLVPTSLNKGRVVYVDEPRSEVSKSIGALAGQIMKQPVGADTTSARAKRFLFKRG